MKRDMDTLIDASPAQLPRWYVVQSQPHKELYSATQLRNQGFRPFVQRIRKTVRHARQMTSVLAPLFPRYLFVSLDLSRDRWRSGRGTFGVSSLVMEGDRPAAVPEGVVEHLIFTYNQIGGDRLSPRAYPLSDGTISQRPLRGKNRPASEPRRYRPCCGSVENHGIRALGKGPGREFDAGRSVTGAADT